MALKLSNNASGILALAISDSATSLTLRAGQGSRFPVLGPGDWFPITVVRASDPSQREIMRCIGRNGDTLTVERAQEGTSAIAFDAGDVVSLRLTAGTLEENFPQVEGRNAKNLSFSIDSVGGKPELKFKSGNNEETVVRQSDIEDVVRQSDIEDVVRLSYLGTAATRDVGTGANNVVVGSDPRLSDAREWTAEVVSQAEAEAGTSSVPRKWTAERVRQAIVARYNALISALTQGAPGAPRIEYPALSPKVQALFINASSLRINLQTTGDTNSNIYLVTTVDPHYDRRNQWYYPRGGGVSQRQITFKNYGAAAVNVVVAAELYVGSDDAVSARLLVNGSAHHQINVPGGGTYQNPVRRKIQFNPVSVGAGQSVYLDIQGLIGSGAGQDWVRLIDLYAWLEA